MKVTDALAVEFKRREAEAEVKLILERAVREEDDANDHVEPHPSPEDRFSRLGKRMVALTDEEETIASNDEEIVRLHFTHLELGTEGIGMVLKARERAKKGGEEPGELDYLAVEWKSTAYVSDLPFATEELGLEQLQNSPVRDDALGQLRLIEQSVSVAELA